MAGKAGFTREGDPMGRFFVGPVEGQKVQLDF